jgi:hypothetical protein
MAMKNGLIESLVISVTWTVSPSGTAARLESPEPAAADPLAAPLALLVAAALVAAAEVVELLAVSLLLPHAVRVTAAAAATTAAASRFVIFVLPARMTTPLLFVGSGRRSAQNQNESDAAMNTALLVMQLVPGFKGLPPKPRTTIPFRDSDRTPAVAAQ